MVLLLSNKTALSQLQQKLDKDVGIVVNQENPFDNVKYHCF